MARLKDIAEGTKDVFMIDPLKLKVREGWNVRNYDEPETQEHIDWLSKDIAKVGVKRPLIIVKVEDDVFIDQGHCRYFATMRALENGAEIKAVPCIAQDRFSSEEDRLAEMITDNEGKPLSPLERAEVYHRFIGFGWDVPRIAERFSRTTKHVTDMLDLRAAGSGVTDLVKQGVVSATLAHETVKTVGATKAAEVLTQAVQTAQAAGKTRATAKHVERTMVTVSKDGQNVEAEGPGAEMVAKVIAQALMAAALTAVKVKVLKK